MKVLGIVGTGVMGTDIAHLAAENGFEVKLYDIDEVQLRDAKEKIEERLSRYVSEGRVEEDRAKEIL